MIQSISFVCLSGAESMGVCCILTVAGRGSSQAVPRWIAVVAAVYSLSGYIGVLEASNCRRKGYSGGEWRRDVPSNAVEACVSTDTVCM